MILCLNLKVRSPRVRPSFRTKIFQFKISVDLGIKFSQYLNRNTCKTYWKRFSCLWSIEKCIWLKWKTDSRLYMHHNISFIYRNTRKRTECRFIYKFTIRRIQICILHKFSFTYFSIVTYNLAARTLVNLFLYFTVRWDSHRLETTNLANYSR